MPTVKVNRTEDGGAVVEGYDHHRDGHCGAFLYPFPNGVESVEIAITVPDEPDINGDYKVEFPDGAVWWVTADNLRAAGVEL